MGGGTAAGDGFGTFFGAAVSTGRGDIAGVGVLAARNFRLTLKFKNSLILHKPACFANIVVIVRNTCTNPLLYGLVNPDPIMVLFVKDPHFNEGTVKYHQDFL